MNEVRITAEAEVKPTEDEVRVRRALGNVVHDGNFKVEEKEGGKVLRCEGSGRRSLAKLFRMFRQQRILDAARKVLFEGRDDRGVEFCLNKQAAFAGRVSFCNLERESPLGPVRVAITCEDPRELIDWIAPSSERRALS